eukprot:scaffold2516_cov207-Chaetoceros_neogracile.AAC.4
MEGYNDEQDSEISEFSESLHTMSEGTYDCEEQGSIVSGASMTSGSITSEEHSDFAAQDSDISDDSTHSEMFGGEFKEEECTDENTRLIEAAIGIMFLIDPEAARAALSLIAGGVGKGENRQL